MQKIAVISSNRTWVNYCLDVLNQSDLYQARERSFDAALKKVPKVDLILLADDCAHFHYTREELCWFIAQAKRQMVPVVYTGTIEPRHLADAFHAGAVYRLEHTFEPTKLLAEVAESFKHKIPA